MPYQSVQGQNLLGIVQKALPQDAPFVLLGESFSGPLAILAAAQQPAQLKGVILCASFVQWPQPLLPTWAKNWLPTLPFVLAPKLLRFKRLFGEFGNVELQQALAKVQANVLRYRLQQVMAVDVTEAIKSLTLPLLYLQANVDLLVPRHNAAQINRLQPNMQVLSFNAGHLLLQAQPSQTAKAIAEFISAVND